MKLGFLGPGRGPRILLGRLGVTGLDSPRLSDRRSLPGSSGRQPGHTFDRSATQASRLAPRERTSPRQHSPAARRSLYPKPFPRQGQADEPGGAHDMLCTTKQSDVTLPMGIAILRPFPSTNLARTGKMGKKRCRNSPGIPLPFGRDGSRTGARTLSRRPPSRHQVSPSWKAIAGALGDEMARQLIRDQRSRSRPTNWAPSRKLGECPVCGGARPARPPTSPRVLTTTRGDVAWKTTCRQLPPMSAGFFF